MPTTSANAEPTRRFDTAASVSEIVATLTRQVQKWSLVSGLCDTVLSGILVAGVLVSIDYSWRPDSAVVRWLISLPFWFTVVWLAARRLGPVALRQHLQAKVVASLCRRYPPLQDQLPAALDFERLLTTDSCRPSQREVSTPLMRHVVAQTLSQLREIDWPRSIDLRHARRSIALTLGLLVAGLGALALRSELIMTGLPRVVIPVYASDWPSWYAMEFQDLPTDVPPFTTIPIRVVSLAGQLPDPIWLETISGSQSLPRPEISSTGRSPSHSTAATPSDRFQLDRTDHTAFGTVTVGDQPIWIRVISDHDPIGAWHRINVVRVPQLLATTSWEVRCSTGERQDSVRVPWGPLRVPPNAQIVLDGELDRAVSQVELEWQPLPSDSTPEGVAQGPTRSGPEIGKVERFSLDVSGRRFKFPPDRSMRVDRPQQARLIVRYAVNSSPLIAGSITIAVHGDQAPAAKWGDTSGTFGSNVLMLTPLANLRLPMILTDDRAVTDYRLAIMAADEPREPVILPDFAWRPVKSPLISKQSLQSAMARPDAPWPTTEVTTDVAWPPEEWRPPVDTTWKVQVVARDSIGQEAHSSVRLLRIVPPAELEARCLAETSELSRLAQQAANRLSDWPAGRDHRTLSQLSMAERQAGVRLVEDTLMTASNPSTGLIRRMTEISQLAQDNQLLQKLDRDHLASWRREFEKSQFLVAQRLLASLRTDVPTASVVAEYPQIYGSLVASWQGLAESLQTLGDQRAAWSELLMIWRRQVELGPRLTAAQRALLAAGGRAELEPVAEQLSDWAGSQTELASRLETWLDPYANQLAATDHTTSRPSEPPFELSDPLARVSAALQAQQITHRMDQLGEEVAVGRLGHALTLYQTVTIDFHAAISAATDIIGPQPVPPELSELAADAFNSAAEPESDDPLDRLRRLAAATGASMSGLDIANLDPNLSGTSSAQHAHDAEAVSPAEARFWLAAQLIGRIQHQLRDSTLKLMEAAQLTAADTPRSPQPGAEHASAVATIQTQQQELADSLSDLLERLQADASAPLAHSRTDEADRPVDDQLDRDLFSAETPEASRSADSQTADAARPNRVVAADAPHADGRGLDAAKWPHRLAEFQRLADAMGQAAGLLRQDQLRSAAIVQLQIIQRLDELFRGRAGGPVGPITAGGEASGKSTTASSTSQSPDAIAATAESRAAMAEDRTLPVRVPDGWGKLPQREQQEIPAVGPEQFLPGYESFIRDYFQRLGK